MHVIVVKYVIVNKYFSAAHCLKQPIQTKQETNLNNLLWPNVSALKDRAKLM